MNHNNSLNKAIEICGLKPLALKIEVSYQAIQNYLKTQVPAEKVIPIAEATEWKVMPHELRPDLYPHPHDGMPELLRTGTAN